MMFLKEEVIVFHIMLPVSQLVDCWYYLYLAVLGPAGGIFVYKLTNLSMIQHKCLVYR